MNLIRGSLAVFVTQLVVLVVGILSSVIMARALGPEGRGSLAIIILVSSLLQKFGDLGVGLASTYYVGQKIYTADRVAFQAMVLGACSSLTMIALFLVVFPLLETTFLRGVNPQLILIAVSAIPLAMVTSHLTGVLWGLNDVVRCNLIGLYRALSELLFMFLGLVVVKGYILGASVAFLLTSLTTALFTVWLVWQKTPVYLSLDERLLKALLSYGLKGQAGNVIQLLNYRLDWFLVNLWLGPTQLGFYALAVSLAEKLRLLPAAIQTVLFPKMSSLNRETANGLAVTVFKNMLFLLPVLSGIFLLCSRLLIVFLYSEDFLPSLGPLMILVPGMLALGLSVPLASYLAGQGKVEYNTYGTIIGAVVTLTLDVLLIPRWNVNGAALASLLSYAATGLVALYFFLKVSGTHLSKVISIRWDDLAIYAGMCTRAWHWLRSINKRI